MLASPKTSLGYRIMETNKEWCYVDKESDQDCYLNQHLLSSCHAQKTKLYTDVYKEAELSK